MSIEIAPEARLLVGLRPDDSVEWIGEEGVLDQRGGDPEQPFVLLRVGDRLQPGQEVWTVRPGTSGLAVLVFDESVVRLRTPSAVEMGPPIDMLFAPMEDGLAPVDAGTSVLSGLLAERAAAPVTETEDEILAVLVDQGPLAAGLAQFSALRDLLEATLDLMSAEADMLCDAADIAVDQVQDMRIAWLEQGPGVKLTDVLLEAAFLATIGAVGTRVAGALVRRGFRSWSRATTAAAVRRETRQAAERTRALGELRAARLKVDGRLQHARLQPARSQSQPVNLSSVPVHQRTRALERQVRERRLQPQLDRTARLERRADELKTSMAELEREVTAANDALKDLGARLGRMSQGGRVTDEALKEMVAAPLREAIPDVSGILGGTMASATGKLVLPNFRQPAGAGTGATLAGDGPSALIRIQVLELRRSQHAEIARIRREIGRLGELAAASPEVALAPAINAVCAITVNMTEPQLGRAEYRQAVLELALELEFSIWSVLFNLFLDRARAGDMFSFSGPDVPGFDLYVRGAPKRVVAYLVERFRPVYGGRSGSGDVERLVEAMRNRRAAVREGGTYLLSALGRDRDEPFAELLRPAVMRDETVEETPLPTT